MRSWAQAEGLAAVSRGASSGAQGRRGSGRARAGARSLPGAGPHSGQVHQLEKSRQLTVGEVLDGQDLLDLL